MSQVHEQGKKMITGSGSKQNLFKNNNNNYNNNTHTSILYGTYDKSILEENENESDNE